MGVIAALSVICHKDCLGIFFLVFLTLLKLLSPFLTEKMRVTVIREHEIK